MVRYGETVWSGLFAGNQHTVQCLQPAVVAAETALELAPAQRTRTVWRVDGGAGSDAQIRWLLARGYHFIGKGSSTRRANALAQQVTRWDAYDTTCWLGEVAPPVDWGRPARCFVKRRLKDGQPRHSYYVSTLSLPSKGRFLALYDQRGQAEVEQFRSDKSGLHLNARRKASFAGQYGYILLTDLAHNLLAHFARHALHDSPFAGYGPLRIVRDLLAVPGHVTFDSDTVRIALLTQKQFSRDLVTCFQRYLATFNCH